MSAAARCPKCSADVAEAAPACRVCGLSRDRFEGYERAPIGAPAAVLAAWQECTGAWEEDGAHDRFTAVAAATGSFPFAARAYRQAAAERAGDPRAAAGLARIQRMAEAALLARPPAQDPARGGRRLFRGAAVLMVALLLVAVLGLSAILVLRGGRGEAERRYGPRGRESQADQANRNATAR